MNKRFQPLNILIIEPYHTGSHASWAGGYKKKSRHNVEILSLEGRYWKWRMHGGAVTLAGRFLQEGLRPDLILATDMLDLTTFLALTRRVTAAVPSALYFHENQITYPWQPGDRDVANGRDGHYGFINFASALAADRVFFNSRYHMDEFLAGLEAFLKAFPDYNEAAAVGLIKARSSVLYVGMDFALLDSAAPEGDGAPREDRPPLILWNHRWEYDKNPEDFFRALYALDDKGLDFEVAILGENFKKRPVEFDEARQRLGERVVRFGFVEDFPSYVRWLKSADIAPVTSNHDFFGCSVIEAVRCGCFPILPRRLAYPEHVAEGLNEKIFYSDFDGLLSRLEWAVVNIAEVRRASLKKNVEKYGWDTLAPIYDREMEDMFIAARPTA
ncbi:MAG: DUF3524 domain-containing protein [Thermodesulfobacteriota bacterium]